MDSQIDTIDKASIIEETNKIDMIAEWEWMDETIDDFMFFPWLKERLSEWKNRLPAMNLWVISMTGELL